jgi:hypothetical protein
VSTLQRHRSLLRRFPLPLGPCPKVRVLHRIPAQKTENWWLVGDPEVGEKMRFWEITPEKSARIYEPPPADW